MAKKQGKGEIGMFTSVEKQITGPDGKLSEDTRRILRNVGKWYFCELPANDEEFEQRVYDFFETCLKTGEVVTVEKLALAMGTNKDVLRDWEVGRSGPHKAGLIKRAKNLIGAMDADLVIEGKINPITYIFRAKNYFGMVDKQEHSIEAKPAVDTLLEQEDLEKLSDAVTIDITPDD